MIYSIRTRLNLWFLALVVIIFIGLFASVYKLQRDSLRNMQALNEKVLSDFVQSNWKSRADALVRMYSNQLVRAVYTKDLETIRDLVEVAVEQGVVASVFVLDESGMILSTGSQDFSLVGRQYAASMRSIADSRLLSAPIKIGSQELGEVVMEFDTFEIEETNALLKARMGEMSNSATQASEVSFLALFAVALLAGLAGAFLIARSLTRPLASLALAIEQVGSGDEELQVPARGDEIGELGKTLVRVDRTLRETTISKSRLEREVEARTMDLQEKARELEEANERLMELDRLKSDFLSSVSHELRTPLTSMLGYSKLIGRDAFRAGQTENSKVKQVSLERIGINAEVIHQETMRLTRLINNVLDLARIEEGSIEWQDKDVDVKEAIQAAVQSAHGSTSRNGDVSLRQQLPEEPLPTLHMDPDRLHQVLINLLDNAFKFTEEGEIVVSASQDDGHVMISVSDMGVGIAEEHFAGIFERFYQSSQDVLTDKPRGSGLGLAICSEIISNYGGTIHVTSTREKGSTFVISLPVKRPGVKASLRAVSSLSNE